MVKKGSLKGTIIKIILVNGHSLDFERICSLVFKEIPNTTIQSIRSSLYNLEKEGYIEKTGDGMYKATQAALDGEVNANLEPSTVKYACSQS